MSQHRVSTPHHRRYRWAIAAVFALAGCQPLLHAGQADPRGAVREERVKDSRTFWRAPEFAEMVPTLRLPTTHDSKDRVRVYLHVPPAGLISARYLEAQRRHTLAFPPGTRADRVESLRFDGGAHGLDETVMDVRGTIIEDGGGKRFHCLRPQSGRAHARLIGWSWPEGDRAARMEATHRLLALAGRAGTPLNQPPLSGTALKALGRLNDCSHCHVPNHVRETSISQAPFPRRETDASGFYVPLSVLHDEVALSATRPLDLNADDPFVTVRCGDRPARLEQSEWTWYRCADGGVPVGRRDVQAAMAAGDPYTLAVCASRRYLYTHMDATARDAFAASFRECGIP